MPVDGPVYPVNLLLAGRRCLVVGGGAVAAQKIRGLLAADARVHVVAARVGPAVRGLDVTFEQRPYRRGEVAGYRLVVTTTDDPAVNRAVYLDGEEAGVWVNSADDPVNCAFILPAVVRRGPIQVAIGTGGRSPALATWLRRRFTDELGPEYLVLLELLGERRSSLRSAGVSTEGLDWQGVLDSGILDLVKAGNVEEARERLRACL